MGDENQAGENGNQGGLRAIVTVIKADQRQAEKGEQTRQHRFPPERERERKENHKPGGEITIEDEQCSERRGYPLPSVEVKLNGPDVAGNDRDERDRND